MLVAGPALSLVDLAVSPPRLDTLSAVLALVGPAVLVTALADDALQLRARLDRGVRPRARLAGATSPAESPRSLPRRRPCRSVDFGTLSGSLDSFQVLVPLERDLVAGEQPAQGLTADSHHPVRVVAQVGAQLADDQWVKGRPRVSGRSWPSGR